MDGNESDERAIRASFRNRRDIGPDLRPILRAEFRLRSDDLTRFDAVHECGSLFLGAPRLQQLESFCADGFAGAVAVHPLGRRIPVRNPEVGIHLVDGVVDRLQQRRLLRQPFLRLLPLGDIGADPGDAIRLLRGVQEQPPTSLNPSHAAIGADDAVLNVMIATFRNRRINRSKHAVAILRVDLVAEGLEGPRKRPRGQSVDRFKARRPFHDASAHRVLPRSHPTRFDGELQVPRHRFSPDAGAVGGNL